jgi:hypothetical protein
MSRNKREILQAIIDDVEESWIVMKPSRYNPMDPDPLCIFENPAELTRASTTIPTTWFENEDLNKIKDAVHLSLRNAETMYPAD